MFSIDRKCWSFRIVMSWMTAASWLSLSTARPSKCAYLNRLKFAYKLAAVYNNSGQCNLDCLYYTSYRNYPGNHVHRPSLWT